jgi:hypothetical protein
MLQALSANANPAAIATRPTTFRKELVSIAVTSLVFDLPPIKA